MQRILKKAKKIKQKEGYIGLALKVKDRIIFEYKKKKSILNNYKKLFKNMGKVEYETANRKINIRYRTVDQYSYLENYKIQDGVISTEKIRTSYLDLDESFDLALDVGGYMGFYTIVLGRLNPNTSLCVFEPAKYNREALKKCWP